MIFSLFLKTFFQFLDNKEALNHIKNTVVCVVQNIHLFSHFGSFWTEKFLL